jgi:hypothetical protein
MSPRKKNIKTLSLSPGRAQFALLAVTIPVFFIASLMYNIYRGNKSIQEESQYFEKLHLKLAGRIIMKNRIQYWNGAEVIKLSVSSSSTDYLDPRPSPPYFCLINRGIAEIYFPTATTTQVGDSISVDSDTFKMYIFRGEHRDTIGLGIKKNKRFYSFLNRNYQKIF